MCVPLLTLEGLDLVANFALTSKDLRLGGCLNASIGGSEKIFFIIWSWIIVFQCVLIDVEMLVKQGWYLTARITLSVLFLQLFLRASNLLTSLAFLDFRANL